MILEALVYLNSQGIIHRDLKPSNILFKDESEFSKIVIADFGFSAMLSDK
jgi:calcium/calmodulin-dependent protein kinase I